MKFTIKDFFSKCDQIWPDLLTFTEEILNGKLGFLCSEGYLAIISPSNIFVMYCFIWSNSSRICPDFFEKSSFVPICSIMCSGFFLSNGARWCFRSSIVTPLTGKVSVFGVILVRIFPHWDWIRTRTTPNTDTLYAVSEIPNSTIWFFLESCFS